MKKALLYRLFGIGKFPRVYATELVNEGILLSDEGIPASVTYRNFRSPGRISSYRRVGNIASIITTNERMAAYFQENVVIDVPFTDSRLRNIAFSVEANGALLVKFDASLFHTDWSGQLEYRFKTTLAQGIVDMVTTRCA